MTTLPREIVSSKHFNNVLLTRGWVPFLVCSTPSTFAFVQPCPNDFECLTILVFAAHIHEKLFPKRATTMETRKAFKASIGKCRRGKSGEIIYQLQLLWDWKFEQLTIKVLSSSKQHCLNCYWNAFHFQWKKWTRQGSFFKWNYYWDRLRLAKKTAVESISIWDKFKISLFDSIWLLVATTEKERKTLKTSSTCEKLHYIDIVERKAI